MVYHDTVTDRNGKEIYTGPPEFVKQWLNERWSEQCNFFVCVGRNERVYSVSEYLNRV